MLAVVEAKRTRREARVGKEQLLQYITKIEVKQSFHLFGFMTNGDDTWFWNSVNYPERLVAGFFSKDDWNDYYSFKKIACLFPRYQLRKAL